MYKFLPLIDDSNKRLHYNTEYFDDVLNLFYKNREFLTDDTFPKGNIIHQLIREINAAEGCFFVILSPSSEFMGCVYLLRWEGKVPQYHSVQIQGFIDRKWWGRDVEKAFSQLLNELFNCKDSTLERVQMEIPEYNKMACSLATRMGFELEGTIRSASKKNGKNVNHLMYSILKEDFNNGKK